MGAGIEFRLADAHGEVRNALHRVGFEHEQGTLQPGQTVDLVVSQWQSSGRGRQPTTHSAPSDD